MRRLIPSQKVIMIYSIELKSMLGRGYKKIALNSSCKPQATPPILHVHHGASIAVDCLLLCFTFPKIMESVLLVDVESSILERNPGSRQERDNRMIDSDKENGSD